MPVGPNRATNTIGRYLAIATISSNRAAGPLVKGRMLKQQGDLQSGTLSDRAQSGGHKNRIESCSWACRAIGLVFLSGATGQTARLANARLLPDRLSCQIAPDINRAIGARLARSLSSDQLLSKMGK